MHLSSAYSACCRVLYSLKAATPELTTAAEALFEPPKLGAKVTGLRRGFLCQPRATSEASTAGRSGVVLCSRSGRGRPSARVETNLVELQKEGHGRTGLESIAKDLGYGLNPTENPACGRGRCRQASEGLQASGEGKDSPDGERQSLEVERELFGSRVAKAQGKPEAKGREEQLFNQHVQQEPPSTIRRGGLVPRRRPSSAHRGNVPGYSPGTH